MQATWSEIDSKESDSTIVEDARYKQNDYLAFVAFVDSMHDNVVTVITLMNKMLLI